jgi:hypothetical protein
MEYNTVREKIVLGEYGRHIKRIVDNCVKIEDRERRNQTAKEIIELMGQLNPHLRNVDDFRHKLWDHLFMISEFKLDVDSPYPKTTKAQIIEKPEPLEYPQTKIRHRHYGKNVAALVDKAVKVEDAEKRAAFAQCIGNYMKLTYQNWNKENTNDEIIKNDLNIISKGELSLSVEDNISELSRANRQNNINNGSNNNKRQFQNNNQNRNNNNGQNRNNNNQNRNNNNGQNRNNNNNNFRKPYNNKNRNNDIQKGQ